MKRLHQLDFMAPAARPWPGYAMLALSLATLLVALCLLWRSRTDAPPADAAITESSRAGSAVTLSAMPQAAATFASSASQGGTGPTVVAGQTETAAAAERLQLDQTRALAGSRVLPWARLLGTIQIYTSNRVELLRIEPHGNIESTPRAPAKVRLTLQARESADAGAFVQALQAEPRLRDVAVVEAPQKLRPGRASTDDTPLGRGAKPDGTWLGFALVAAWRDPPESTSPRISSGTAASAAASRP
jgi:hypothetical protein